ncbi:MAG TPA: hypothetical protein VL282_04315, partial [Tepidisphaeraceae bacterium]|nr:hypothetical protein [Tepidisphaeraceae bacterium]
MHPALPHCHEFHFLQMACEKICKAHLMAKPGADALELQKKHAYISTTLPLIARAWLARQHQHRQRETHVVTRIRKLSEKIDRLAPANSAGG